MQSWMRGTKLGALARAALAQLRGCKNTPTEAQYILDSYT